MTTENEAFKKSGLMCSKRFHKQVPQYHISRTLKPSEVLRTPPYLQFKVKQNGIERCCNDKITQVSHPTTHQQFEKKDLTLKK
jgi:hypothetical protein